MSFLPSSLRVAHAGCVLLAGTALLSSARAAFYDAPGFRVEAMVSAREDYDSNIFLNNNDVSDLVTTFTGSVKLVRDVALLKSQVTLGASGSMFADHGKQNSFDPSLRAFGTFTPSDKTTLTADFGLSRSSMANEALNTRTRSNDYDFGGSLQSLFSEKLGYRVTGSYHDHNYLTAGYSDVFNFGAGVDAVYVYSPKLTMVGGFSHRESWTENRGASAANPASSDATVSVGLEGELAPKVSGSIRGGWVHRSFDSAAFQSSSAFYFATGVKWVPAQKTSVAIDASQDFDTTAANQSSKVASFTVGVTQIINDKWSVDGSVAFSHSNFTAGTAANNRTDDNYRVKGRASYALATNVGLEFSLGYGNVNSTNTISTYDRVNAGVGITASF